MLHSASHLKPPAGLEQMMQTRHGQDPEKTQMCLSLCNMVEIKDHNKEEDLGHGSASRQPWDLQMLRDSKPGVNSEMLQGK